MSIFEQEKGHLNEAKKPEICKPDYEGQIEGLEKRQQASACLYEAMMGYLLVHDPYRMDAPMTFQHILGALDLEIAALEKSITYTLGEMHKQG